MINVLIVDDDAMVADLNRLYVNRVEGFSCCGVASTLNQAEAIINNPGQPVDLVLLDVYMQQDNGLDLLPVIRASGRPIDVIMISSAADAATIQTSIHYGVVDYLIKPFQFPRFEEALNGWKAKHNLMGSHQYYEQADVDRLIHGGAPELADSKKLPKGLTPQTLRTICQWIDAHPETEFSTDDLANAVNISRVSCRKYLIWLAQINILFTSIHYGVVDYLIKPFQFPRFEEALNGWKAKHSLMGSHQYYEQADVDRLIHGGAPELADSKKLPKGLTPQTLRTICQWIDAHPETEFSTDDLANAVNISRVSCRKYLIWLAQINILFTSIHYGATGRPVYRYRLQPEQTGLLKQYCQ